MLYFDYSTQNQKPLALFKTLVAQLNNVIPMD